jgi:hypothetical protein
MTLTQTLERTLIRAGLVETTTSEVNKAREYVNAVVQDIASRATWWWLFKQATFTTSASTRNYALATDVLTPVSFRDTTNNRTLPIKSDSDIDLDDPDQSRTGQAESVYLTGANSTTGALEIALHPTPTSSVDVITYRYYKTIPEFTSANDADDLFTTHGIPLLLHQAIYMGAAAMIQVEQGDDAGAQYNESKMERIINQAREVNGRMSGNRSYRLQRDNADVSFSFTIEEGSL